MLHVLGGVRPPPRMVLHVLGGVRPPPHDAACITKRFATFSPFPRCYETFTRVARKKWIKFTVPEEIWTGSWLFSGAFRGVFRGGEETFGRDPPRDGAACLWVGQTPPPAWCCMSLGGSDPPQDDAVGSDAHSVRAFRHRRDAQSVRAFRHGRRDAAHRSAARAKQSALLLSNAEIARRKFEPLSFNAEAE